MQNVVLMKSTKKLVEYEYWEACDSTFQIGLFFVRYEPKDLQFRKEILQVSESSFWPCFLVLCIIVTFWSFYGKIVAKAYSCPRESQFAKHCQTPHKNVS